MRTYVKLQAYVRTFTEDTGAVEARVAATPVRALRVVAVRVDVTAVALLRLTMVFCKQTNVKPM